jgi:multicomponent Na+:H+ antiporter subunit E
MTKKHGAVFLYLLLFLFWLILSAKLDLVIIVTGLLASLLVVFYNYDLIFNPLEATRLTLRTIKRLIVLFFVLIMNIVKSNIEVAKIVLSPKMKIDPGFVSIRQPLKKELNQAFYANAITLTPGTLSIDCSNNVIIVHGLVQSQVKSIEGSSLEKVFIDFEEEGGQQ